MQIGIFLIILFSFLRFGIKEVSAQQTDMFLRLNLTAKICLSGDRSTENIQAGEFACYIVSEDPNVQIDTNLREVEAGGKVELGSFSFTGEGVYIFLVKQKQMGKTGYVYDQTQYRIVVKVSYDQTGKLQAKQWYIQNGENSKEAVFYNTYKEPGRSVSEGILEMDIASAEEVKAGVREVTHTITFSNVGESPLLGLWGREYIPAYGGYIEHSGEGTYGAIKGREHITYYMASLRPGEERKVTITFRIGLCRPMDWKEEVFFLYEILGEDIKPAVNELVDPSEYISYGEIK